MRVIVILPNALQTEPLQKTGQEERRFKGGSLTSTSPLLIHDTMTACFTSYWFSRSNVVFYTAVYLTLVMGADKILQRACLHTNTGHRFSV